MTPLLVPTLCIPGMISSAEQQVFRDTFKRPEAAEAGDILGMIQDIRFENGHNEPMELPISRVIAMPGENSKYPVDMLEYTQIDEARKSPLAHAAMTRHSSARADCGYSDILATAFDLDSGDPDDQVTYVQLYFFRDLVLAQVENYEDEMINGRFFGDPVDQDVVASLSRLVFPFEIECHHQRVDTLREFGDQMRLAASLIRVPNEDEIFQSLLEVSGGKVLWPGDDE